MSVISEEKLVAYLGRVIALSSEVLPRLVEEGTQDPPASLAESYQKLVEDLSAERRDDSYLQDESWDWIFDGQEPGNLIKVYGRLAWVNLQLLEMM